MKVLAQFVCESVKEDEHGNHDIRLRPICPNDAPGDPEVQKFWDATPSGSLHLDCVNKTAAAQFVPGATYNVTLQRQEETRT